MLIVGGFSQGAVVVGELDKFSRVLIERGAAVHGRDVHILQVA